MVISVFLSVMTGVTIVSSRLVNAKLAERTSARYSTLMNYVVGLTCAIIVLLVSKEKAPQTLPNISIGNLFIFLGGVMGVCSILINNIITNKLPSFELTLLMFVGQLFAGIALDYFILNTFSFGKFAGGILVFIGLWLSIKSDNKEERE